MPLERTVRDSDEQCFPRGTTLGGRNLDGAAAVRPYRTS